MDKNELIARMEIDQLCVNPENQGEFNGMAEYVIDKMTKKLAEQILDLLVDGKEHVLQLSDTTFEENRDLFTWIATRKINNFELVRCKQCEYSYEWDSGPGPELVCQAKRCDPYDWGNTVIFYVKEDGYCSEGKRKGFNK